MPGALLGTLVFLPISMKTDFGVVLALGAAVTEPWGDLMLDWYLRTIVVM